MDGVAGVELSTFDLMGTSAYHLRYSHLIYPTYYISDPLFRTGEQVSSD